MKINIVNGDITHVEADTLVTFVNSAKDWRGGVDRAIMRSDGELHYKALAHSIDNGLSDGGCFYSEQPSRLWAKSVLFVIDDLQQPVNELVQNALQAGLTLDLHHFAMPAFRCGIMAGRYEKTIEETVRGILHGISYFANDPDIEITFVIYNEPSTEMVFKRLASGYKELELKQ